MTTAARPPAALDDREPARRVPHGAAPEDEVAAARIRLVQAADEERRRIGRDLHDGAQQRLVVLAHCLDVALAGLDRGEDVRELLAAARAQAAEVAGEVRDLARGLHPAGLSAHGLRGALRGLALRSPLPLRLGALRRGGCRRPSKPASFYLVSEGLANAVKHAGATEVRVKVVVDGAVLAVEVADDGAGGAMPEAGGGLAGLADRLTALGGRLDVESPTGAGTRLRGLIPLAASHGMSPL